MRLCELVGLWLGNPYTYPLVFVFFFWTPHRSLLPIPQRHTLIKLVILHCKRYFINLVILQSYHSDLRPQDETALRFIVRCQILVIIESPYWIPSWYLPRWNERLNLLDSCALRFPLKRHITYQTSYTAIPVQRHTLSNLSFIELPLTDLLISDFFSPSGWNGA